MVTIGVVCVTSLANMEVGVGTEREAQGLRIQSFLPVQIVCRWRSSSMSMSFVFSALRIGLLQGSPLTCQTRLVNGSAEL